MLLWQEKCPKEKSKSRKDTLFMARKMPKIEIKIKKRHLDIVHMYCILIGKGNMGFHIGLSVVPSIHTIDLTFWLGNW